MQEYDYTKSPVEPTRLEQEIDASSIVTALDHITTVGSDLAIFFKAALSGDDKATLDSIVSAHTGAPLSYPTLVTLNAPGDSDNSPIFRPKTTRTGWHFEPRSLDWWTSKFKSLYNRKYDTATVAGGTDIGDATMRFFDSSNTELTQGDSESDSDFQTRLTANCVMTWMDWEPHYDYDIVGMFFQIRNPSADPPAYFWLIIAPDIPANLGGSIPLCNGGWNLSFFQDRTSFDADGKGVKTLYYSNIYHSNKIRALIKHDVGQQIGIQLIPKHYRA